MVFVFPSFTFESHLYLTCKGVLRGFGTHQDVVNGETTLSPTRTLSTPAPASTTVPVNSCPKMKPGSGVSRPLKTCSSLHAIGRSAGNCVRSGVWGAPHGSMRGSRGKYLGGDGKVGEGGGGKGGRGEAYEPQRPLALTLMMASSSLWTREKGLDSSERGWGERVAGMEWGFPAYFSGSGGPGPRPCRAPRRRRRAWT